jgi:O-methyltransferase
MSYIPGLLQRHRLISDQVDQKELSIILTELEKLLEKNATGSIVEFGCFSGTTSLFIRRLLDNFGASNEFHVYDSFEGLPEKAPEDRSPSGEHFIAGELKSTKQQLLQNFKKANLRSPIIHKNWFENLIAADIPETVLFAFLDGDYYHSIKACLDLIEAHLMPESIIIIDDYHSEALPGAKKATDQWRSSRPQYRLTNIHSLAVIRTSH